MGAWFGAGAKDSGRALHDAHLRRDTTAPKMGHPALWRVRAEWRAWLWAGSDSEAEFGADGVGDGVGVVAHEGLGFGFDHDAGEGFGAAVADDDAA